MTVIFPTARDSDGCGTVKPRYSVFRATCPNYALRRGFHYCQLMNNYENATLGQIIYALLAELQLNPAKAYFKGLVKIMLHSEVFSIANI